VRRGMTGDDLRRTLRDGQTLLGTWSCLGGMYALELVAASGFDWICIDLQHGLTGEGGLAGLLQAADAAGVPALVRVSSNEPASIGRALDLGAPGVIVPLVETAAAAAAAVGACRYPPLGSRSWGSMRPVATDAAEVEEPLRVVMIETERGVAAADEIAAVDGVDAIFVGPSDLSLSTSGTLGAELEPALARVEAACRDNEVAIGIACADSDRVKAACAAGYRLLTVGWDIGFLASGAAATLAAARAASSDGSQQQTV
jgi:4-hydroxy-2-oxoheptanedioate aldolase